MLNRGLLGVFVAGECHRSRCTCSMGQRGLKGCMVWLELKFTKGVIDTRNVEFW